MTPFETNQEKNTYSEDFNEKLTMLGSTLSWTDLNGGFLKHSTVCLTEIILVSPSRARTF